MTCRTRIDGDVAYLTLTKGYVAVIDVADVLAVGGYCWRASVRGNTVYAQRSAPRDSDGKRYTILLHRVILSVGDGVEVDHWDMNGLNNRRSNLRSATRSQNMHNRSMYRNNASQVKGAYWNVSAQKWHAQIRVHGVKKHLGLFHSKEAAHAAYRAASRDLHGEFGRTM